MPVSALVGLQWGDEGKGKIADLLAEKADVVVRCQGGSNAGHTVVTDGGVFSLSLVPSGIFRENAVCVIGNGVVADPIHLAGELKSLEGDIPDPAGRLFISDRAHMVMPWHKALDILAEEHLGQTPIGTTRQGIAPAYMDKAKRSGFRWHHARNAGEFRKRVLIILAEMNIVINALGGTALPEQETADALCGAVDSLRPHIADTVSLLHGHHRAGKRILLEGAQGTMLDIDFGTYPFVTSSNTTSGGCVTGSGLPPASIAEVHGILKSFTTRVGAGPFPTEAPDAAAALLRGAGTNRWDEFAAATGRPHRCGWLDLVAARHSARVNGVTRLHITKLDILSQFDELRIAVAYRMRGGETSDLPSDIRDLDRCEPVYETLPGWKKQLPACKSVAELPEAARNYVERIGEFLEADIATVSYGPGRGQTAFTA